MGDWIDILEAGYLLEPEDEQWLAGIGACLNEVPGLPAWMLFTYDASTDGAVQLGSVASTGIPPELLSKVFFELPGELRTSTEGVPLFRHGNVVSMSGAMSRVPVMGSYLRQQCRRFGLEDLLLINGVDPSHRGVALVGACPKPVELSTGEVSHWQRIAVHLSTAHRLRRNPRGEPDAVLTRDGGVEHARADAVGRTALQSLRAAAVRVDKAQGSQRRDGGEALALWQSLVSARWTLADHFDHDGRRYLVAHRNAPAPLELPNLSSREAIVAGYVALGHSNKLIAYELGISLASVSVYVRRVRTKLGAGSRVELVRMLAIGNGSDPTCH